MEIEISRILAAPYLQVVSRSSRSSVVSVSRTTKSVTVRLEQRTIPDKDCEFAVWGYPSLEPKALPFLISEFKGLEVGTPYDIPSAEGTQESPISVCIRRNGVTSTIDAIYDAFAKHYGLLSNPPESDRQTEFYDFTIQEEASNEGLELFLQHATDASPRTVPPLKILESHLSLFGGDSVYPMVSAETTSAICIAYNLNPSSLVSAFFSNRSSLESTLYSITVMRALEMRTVRSAQDFCDEPQQNTIYHIDVTDLLPENFNDIVSVINGPTQPSFILVGTIGGANFPLYAPHKRDRLWYMIGRGSSVLLRQNDIAPSTCVMSAVVETYLLFRRLGKSVLRTFFDDRKNNAELLSKVLEEAQVGFAYKNGEIHVTSSKLGLTKTRELFAEIEESYKTVVAATPVSTITTIECCEVYEGGITDARPGLVIIPGTDFVQAPRVLKDIFAKILSTKTFVAQQRAEFLSTLQAMTTRSSELEVAMSREDEGLYDCVWFRFVPTCLSGPHDGNDANRLNEWITQHVDYGINPNVKSGFWSSKQWIVVGGRTLGEDVTISNLCSRIFQVYKDSEIECPAHLRAIEDVLRQSIQIANQKLQESDGVSVTYSLDTSTLRKIIR